jgi:N utilization substance protein B
MSSRRRSRQRALQILFLWDARRQPVEDAINAYYDTLAGSEEPMEGGSSGSPAIRPAPDPFASRLVYGTIEHLAEVDEQISRHAEHWRMERMPAVDRNILRLAVYEMTRGGTPAAVTIDEALELARRFSGEESVQFVNGVLDAIHRALPSTQNAAS